MTDNADTAAVDAALMFARLQGCTCTPDVTIERHAEGIAYARMAHDQWCPLLLARNAHRN